MGKLVRAHLRLSTPIYAHPRPSHPRPFAVPRPQRQGHCGIKPGVVPIQALPWVKAQCINNPERVVPKDRTGGMWYWVYICKSFREDSSSPPANPIPFRPLISHPPTATNGTTPCGVGNALRPEPGVVRRPAQPRAVWHNALGVGGGEPRMGVDGRGPISPSGNA